MVTDVFHTANAREIDEAELTRFTRAVNRKHALHLQDYWELHAWSVAHYDLFYELIWDYYGIIGEKGAAPLVNKEVSVLSIRDFLPRARLNYAENVLFGHPNAMSDCKLAIVDAFEPISPQATPIKRSLTFKSLAQEVNILLNAMRKLNIKPGDRIAAYSANNAEAVISVLAATALGGIFTSVAAEMGPKGVLERFEQTKPEMLFVVSEYRWNGKVISVEAKVKEVVKALAAVGLKHVIFVDQLCTGPKGGAPIHGVRRWSWEEMRSFGQEGGLPESIPFHRGPAMSPLWILYSSGTTGKPKALVHSAGGMVIHTKIANNLHSNLTSTDMMVQSTTLGWMMWNNAVNYLCTGGGIVTYDGSPLAPLGRLFDIVERTGATAMGLSPRFLAILQKANYHPKDRHRLDTLKTILCAGSALSPDLYKFIFSSIRHGVFICNGSGGTDVCGGIVSGVFTLPSYAGQIQAPVLGYNVEAFNEEGKPVWDETGLMVITTPIPNMPLGLLDDEDGSRFRGTYFDDFLPRIVWNQADMIQRHSDSKGFTVLGRSDGVLNPGGVRFGTTELYNIADAEFESIVVPFKHDHDEKVIMFVKTPSGQPPDSKVIERVKKALSTQLSPRHVPALFFGVTDIPYNGSMKKLETAVRKVVNGASLKSVNTSACVNPECLPQYVELGKKIGIALHKPKL